MPNSRTNHDRKCMMGVASVYCSDSFRDPSCMRDPGSLQVGIASHPGAPTIPTQGPEYTQLSYSLHLSKQQNESWNKHRALCSIRASNYDGCGLSTLRHSVCLPPCPFVTDEASTYSFSNKERHSMA
mmetsp:Transcript_3201/g.5244  ORF Transcript_3201/g.5244 Transcript_3201/m.5244 type:complete len:127 (-) Transcript_3201:100-480(-)